MNVFNYSTIVTQKLTEDLIGLLEPVYQSIPTTVINCDQVRDAKKYLLETKKYWDQMEAGKIGGTYNRAADRIVMYPKAKLQFKEAALLEYAFSLYHEIRHAYQRHLLTDIYLYEMEHFYNSDVTTPNYEKQWLEVDANYFATTILNQNKKHIIRIVNYRYGTFQVKPVSPPFEHPLERLLNQTKSL